MPALQADASLTSVAITFAPSRANALAVASADARARRRAHRNLAPLSSIAHHCSPALSARPHRVPRRPTRVKPEKGLETTNAVGEYLCSRYPQTSFPRRREPSTQSSNGPLSIADDQTGQRLHPRRALATPPLSPHARTRAGDTGDRENDVLMISGVRTMAAVRVSSPPPLHVNMPRPPRQRGGEVISTLALDLPAQAAASGVERRVGGCGARSRRPPRKCLARSTVLRQPMLRRQRSSHFSVSLRPAPCR